jgi:hypothetical protein
MKATGLKAIEAIATTMSLSLANTVMGGTGNYKINLKGTLGYMQIRFYTL